jgi:hypothetical protein
MKLTVLERLLLLNYLPKEGSLADFRILKAIKTALSFSEEEHKALEFHEEGQQIRWKPEAEPKDIEIGERALFLIKQGLTPIAAKGVNDENFSLFEKFEIEESGDKDNVLPFKKPGVEPEQTA